VTRRAACAAQEERDPQSHVANCTPRIARIAYLRSVTLPTLDEVRTVAVIGAGTMGHGIAHVVAQMGARVHLYDAMQGAAQAGVAKITRNLDKGVELGKVRQAERDAAVVRLVAFDELTPACQGADCVIEAVPERLELKREIFASIDAIAPAHALLATNKSSLPVGEIATSVREPARVVGMHFFNPVHLMKLVEVVRHGGTSPAAVALAVGLAEKLGKAPIVVTDSPGFVSSRLGLVLGPCRERSARGSRRPRSCARRSPRASSARSLARGSTGGRPTARSGSCRYAATDSLAPTAGLWRRASRAGTRTSAVATQAISPISDARPKPRIARFSLMRSEP
jgi:hypothetical protein